MNNKLYSVSSHYIGNF